jgi:hypothetical protein
MKLTIACVVVLVLVQTAAARGFSVPFEVHGKRNAILVRVVVNGKPHTFVLDTGAARTVVSPNVLGGLAGFNLKLSRFRARGPGFAGEAILERVDSLRLGEKTWHDRRVVVMDLEEVSKVYSRQIDGLIGQDLLREFNSVLIDFKNSKLTLSR